MKGICKILVCLSLVAMGTHVAAAHEKGSPPEKVCLKYDNQATSYVCVEPFVIAPAVIEVYQPDAAMAMEVNAEPTIASPALTPVTDVGIDERIRAADYHAVNYDAFNAYQLTKPPSDILALIKDIEGSTGGMAGWRS